MKLSVLIFICAVLLFNAFEAVIPAEINSGKFLTEDILLHNSAIITEVTEDSDIRIPVGLIFFKYETDRNKVTLTWLTNFETNNSRYEIERQNVTVNGTGGWSMIGSVTGVVSSVIPTYYSFVDERLNTGKYNYRLKQIDMNDDYVYFYLSSEVEIGIKKIYKLSQNYPNPFNPSTKIDFEIHGEGIVNIRLFDMSGKELKTLLREFKNPGYYTLDFNGEDLSGGVYIYRLEVDGILKDTKQMILLK